MRNLILNIISNPVPERGMDIDAGSPFMSDMMPFRFTYSVETGCIFQIFL